MAHTFKGAATLSRSDFYLSLHCSYVPQNNNFLSFLSCICSTMFYLTETSRNSIVTLSLRYLINHYCVFIFQACLNDIQEVVSLQYPQALSGKIVNLQKFCERKLSSSQHLNHGKY